MREVLLKVEESRSDGVKRLFVGNVPFRAKEDELQDWFNQSGIDVDSVHLIRDRASGEPRGFGFVEVSDDEQAERAVQACNGSSFMGRSLIVNEARPRGSGPVSGQSMGAGRSGGMVS